MIFIRAHNYLMCFGKILSLFKVSIIICKIFPHSPGFFAMLAIVKSFCGEIIQIHQRCTAHGAHCDRLIFFGWFNDTIMILMFYGVKIIKIGLSVFQLASAICCIRGNVKKNLFSVRHISMLIDPIVDALWRGASSFCVTTSIKECLIDTSCWWFIMLATLQVIATSPRNHWRWITVSSTGSFAGGIQSRQVNSSK